MKQLSLLCLSVVMMHCAIGQNFSLSTLLDFSSLPYTKFDNVVSKKGFRKLTQEEIKDTLFKKYLFSKTKKKEVRTEFLSYCSKSNENFICYEIENKNDYQQLESDLKKAFHYAQKSTTKFPVLYQRENVRVTVNSVVQDSTTRYQFFVEQKLMPKPKDIMYAEDLLKLSSHEYLVSVFGERNVMKDVFYFSEKELNKCSILFPNTNQEVVFVWKDEDNFSDISFLIIGGHIQTEKTMHFDNQVEQNVWRSNQGIYTGMSLAELQELNGQGLKFYGWQLDYAGAIMPQSKGKINFDRIGCVLNCLNCSGATSYQKQIVNSDQALADNKKIYVTTMIILPEKENSKM